MPSELSATKGTAVYIGCECRSSPTATLPNVTWASPSPIRDKRFKTRKTPNVEHNTAIKHPAMRAFCIK
jgi:hypothetical protein